MRQSPENFDAFLKISVLLTGFNKLELQGTGMLETYFNTIITKTVPSDLKLFFEKIIAILDDPTADDMQRIASIRTSLIPDSSYNGLAKKIITLWYTGIWTIDENNSEVVSAESFVQGLVWAAAHTHPSGAKQPGYGSWSTAPIGITA